MNPHTDGRSYGAAMRPLSALQIKDLILLARQTFEHLCDTGVLGESAEFDVWRHQQIKLCVERAGLRECRNEDYLLVRAHLLHLQGNHAAAVECEFKSLNEKRTQAMKALLKACEEVKDVLPDAWGYACGFVRNKRQTEMENADTNTIWHAFYTVKRRAEQLRKPKLAKVAS